MQLSRTKSSLFHIAINSITSVSLVFFFSTNLFAANPVVNSPHNVTSVAFIDQTPIVDGKLDARLDQLIKNEFKQILDFDNPKVDPVEVTYRMGYTPSHFYLYIETDSNYVSYHRRGYLWGDGYKLLLCIPQDEGLTGEYYEMSFSPTLEDDYLWDKQRISTYNFTAGKKSFSDRTRSQEWSEDGKSGFEALIAWSDIRPYHPWFQKDIGYNLYFAKGFNTAEHGYFTNGYITVEDQVIWDEEIGRRAYLPLAFERPASYKSTTLLTQLERGNIWVDEPLTLNIVSLGPTSDRAKLDIKLSNGSGKVVMDKSATVDVSNKISETTVSLDTTSLAIGNYKLSVTVNDQVTASMISILPDINFASIRALLEKNKDGVITGALHTLLFKLQALEKGLAQLKLYDTGKNFLEHWNTFENEFLIFQNGKDPYEGKTGPYRRGFKSKYDGSYQPYTIKLPNNYDSTKRYPLLVFMHGSGQDEQTLLNRPRSNGKFIELAPYGRDKFRAYASQESQIDIVEAIDAVISTFSVDKETIIIGGFSMGGYGALRVYYEHPELYKGVAVFAGHPNLASEWLGQEHPNFLDEKYLM